MKKTITRAELKELVRQTIQEDSEYQAFFKKALEKAGKSIPSMSDEEKKKFFDKIDAAWKARGEKAESNEAKINEESDKFIARYNGKTIEVHGKDLWDATQKARAQLKVPKSKQGLLSVQHEDYYKKQQFRYESRVNEVAKDVKASSIKVGDKISISDRYKPNDINHVFVVTDKSENGGYITFRGSNKGKDVLKVKSSSSVALYESRVSEVAKDTDWADAIAQNTGTRSKAVLDFAKANKIDIEKLALGIMGKKFKASDFSTALSGTPGNPVHTKLIKMFGESINEDCGCGGNKVNEVSQGDKVKIQIGSTVKPRWKKGTVDMVYGTRFTVDVGGKLYSVDKTDVNNTDRVKFESKITEDGKLQGGGDDPCWKGYEMVGMKKGKGGKDVPNCVPKNESINEAFKHTIKIDKPSDVKSPKVKQEIEKLAKKGIRSKEIGLEMGFTTSNQKGVTDEFQKVKNQVYFGLNKNESVNEDIKYSKDGYVKRMENEAGKLVKDIKIKGVQYRYNPVYKTYNSVKGNELLHKSHLGIKEESEYKTFFKKALEKTGKDKITSMSDEEKKAFFNKVDAAWKAKGEKSEVNEMNPIMMAQIRKQTDAVMDKQITNPKTKEKVKVGTALKDKNHPAHNQAKSLFQRIKSSLSGKSKNENIKEWTQSKISTTKVDAKKVADKMRKNQTMKAYADKVSKMGKVSERDLHDLLPDYVSGGDIRKVCESKEINEAGTLKAKRYTKDLAHDLGNQPKLMRPDKFKEFAELDRKGQAKAFNIWRYNVEMER